MIFQDIFAVSPFRLCVTTTEAKRIATYNVAIQKLLLIRGVGLGGGETTSWGSYQDFANP